MPTPYAIPTLAGELVRLEPATAAHLEGLFEAANEDRSNYLYTKVPRTNEETASYVAELLREWECGDTIPFVQISLGTQRVVGVTRFMTIRRRTSTGPPFAVEIGGTWLAGSAQRTGVNTEAKLLLLQYAFTVLDVVRVDFKTDARNARSRAAILRLGSTFEGVLRSFQPSLVAGEEGLFRDSAMFSIVKDEWSGVLESLVWQMSRH